MYTQQAYNIRNWHPASYKFENPVSKTRAEEAIREGDALREKIRNRRILLAI